MKTKIKTEEELTIKWQERIQGLLALYPSNERTNLLTFHNEASRIDSWGGEELKRLKKKK